MFPCDHSNFNAYINNLCAILRDDYNILGAQNWKKYGILKLLSADIYCFNWYENVGSSSYVKTFLNLYKRKLFIYILKLFNKKIVWTIHNNYSHSSSFLEMVYEMSVYMAKMSDRIHVLCQDTCNMQYLNGYYNKIYHIYHGDYFDNYPKSNVDIYCRYNIDRNKKIILFLGLIRKYKNIDILIEAFNKSMLNKDFILLICGTCKDELKKELCRQNYENIVFDFSFIRDDEISAYLDACDLLVAPYDKINSLNSGTLWMAMSYKKTMVLPLIGCLKDFDYDKYLYVYDYISKSEHIQNLINCFDKVYKERELLVEKGLMCYNYMYNVASWEKNKDKWISLFSF